MVVLQVFRSLLLIGEVLVAVPILYLCLLSCSAMLAQRGRTLRLRKNADTETRAGSFAILVPAHNEEVIIATLLKSLARLDYPEACYQTFVVADNCTDRTAVLARSFERTSVYERFDQEQRGKGYALSWILQKLEADGQNFEAYVVLDADSVVEPGFLRSLSRELATGAVALQASNTVLNTTASPSTALRWIALSLMNHVRPLGRNGIGGSSTLTGNGMCLSHALLQQYPWQAFSLGEDYQYYLNIVRHGQRVRYVPEALVRSEMPTRFDQMRTQDIRWEATEKNQSTWQRAAELVRPGLKHGDFVRIEAAIELLVPPLSFLVVLCGVVLVGAVLLGSVVMLVGSLLLIAGLLFYISTPFLLLRPPVSVYKAFLYAPGFIFWKLRVYFVLRKKAKYTGEWIRTDRITS